MLDEELRFIILGCMRQDREAQRKLYYHFFKEMYAYVRKFINDEDKAEEVLNNGFLRVFKKIDMYNGTGSLAGWVKRIMFNSAYDYIKANKKDRLYFPEELWCSEVIRADDNLKYKELINLVNSLPEKTRKAFTLFAEGFTHYQIADILDISEGTSKWHIHEARRILQKKI